jgi:hypothetical protein
MREKQGLLSANATPAPPAETSPVPHLAMAWIGVLAATAMLLSHLRHNGFWIDEAYSMHAIGLPWGEMALERLKRGHFPLYFSLLKVLSQLAGGPTEISLRLPSVVFWLASVVSFWFLARRWLPCRVAALAVTFAALNGLAIRQAGEARMYDLVLLEAIWVTRAYVELLKGSPKTHWKVVFAVGSVLGFWTSSSFALTGAVFLFDAFRRRKNNPALIRIAVATIAATLLSAALPVLVHLQTRDRGEIAHVRPANLVLHVATFVAGITGADDYYTVPPSLAGLQLVGGGFATCVLISLYRRRRKLDELEQLSFRIVVLPICAMTVTWLLSEIQTIDVGLHGPARYLMGTMPCGALLASMVIANWCSSSRRRLFAAHLAVLAILMTGAWITIRLRTETCRELIFDLAEHIKPDDALIVVPDQARETVEMYLPGKKADLAIARWMLDESAVAAMLKPFEERDTVWLAWIHGKKSPAIRVADRLFGEGETSSPKSRLGERRVYRYEPRKGIPNLR